MGIGYLDHVNIRTTQLDVMIDWYTRILGLHSGPRPQFSFPGAWMYAGDKAPVHLVGIDGTPGMGSEEALKLEHFALAATGRDAFEASLKNNDVEYRLVEIREFNTVQYNLWDPDGNHIHVDFTTDE